MVLMRVNCPSHSSALRMDLVLCICLHLALRKQLHKVWTKGAKYLTQRALSKSIVKTLKSLEADKEMWPLMTLDKGNACVFFHKKLQELLIREKKRKRRRNSVKQPYTILKSCDAGDMRREMFAMWHEELESLGWQPR